MRLYKKMRPVPFLAVMLLGVFGLFVGPGAQPARSAAIVPGDVAWMLTATALVLLMTPDTFFWQLAAFALFRYFDITKPQPARYFDEHVKNGFGVMADDLVAAGYTLLSLALLKIVFA